MSRRPADSVRALASLLAALLGLSAPAALSGCPGPDDADGRTVVRLVVWKPQGREAWDEAIRRFEQRHPRVRIERELTPSSSTLLHALLTQKLRNEDPSLDVFIMDVVWPPELALAGWAEPLDERFPETERAAFFPATIDAVTVRGHVYGVPFNIDAGVLYYRKDLLARHGRAPPRTWPELAATARAIVEAERAAGDGGLYGLSLQLKQYEGLVCNALELVGAAGGDLAHPGSGAVAHAIRFARDELVGDVAPRGVLTYEEQPSLDLFKRGGAVFHRNWPYAWSVLQDPSVSDVAGRVGITTLPAFPGGESVSCLGGWSFGIHSRSRKKDEAFAFIRHMTSPEIQRLFAVKAGKAPSRRGLYDDPAVLAENPHFEDLRPAFEAARPRPKTPIYPRVSNILQRHIHRALSDPTSDVAALMDQAAAEIDAAELRLLGRRVQGPAD